MNSQTRGALEVDLVVLALFSDDFESLDVGDVELGLVSEIAFLFDGQEDSLSDDDVAGGADAGVGVAASENREGARDGSLGQLLLDFLDFYFLV